MNRIRKADPRDGWYEIGPAEAQKFLECALPNRPLREFRAEAIAEEIKAGRWKANAEPLTLTFRGLDRCDGCGARLDPGDRPAKLVGGSIGQEEDADGAL